MKPLFLCVVILGAALSSGCQRTLMVDVALETLEPQTSLGKVAYITGGDVWVLDLDSGRSNRMTRDGYNSTPKWSSDGRYLAFLKRGQLWVVDPRSLQASMIYDVPVDWFAWSPQDENLAVYSRRMGLVVWNAATQFGEGLPPVLPGEIQENFAWSGNANTLVFNLGSIEGGKYRVSLVKADLDQSENQTLYASDDLGSLPRLALPSPDGRWLAYWNWDTESPFAEEAGLPVCILAVPEVYTRCTDAHTIPTQEFLSWSPSGALALVAEDPLTAGASLVVVEAGTMDQRTLVAFIDQSPLYPAWSPDGERITLSARPANPHKETRGATTPDSLSAGRRIWIVDASAGKSFMLTKDALFSDEYPLWSPDGKQILFARLGEEGASLWMVDAQGDNLRQVVPELTPRPEPVGAYGYVDWKALWDWWRP